MFRRIFNLQREPPQTERAEVLSGGPSIFTPFSGNAYESDIYRAAVDSLSRNVAKLQDRHVIKMSRKRAAVDSYLNRILQVRPNPYMTASVLIYKLVTHYYLFINAFAYLQKDDTVYLQAIWPLRLQSM